MPLLRNIQQMLMILLFPILYFLILVFYSNKECSDNVNYNEIFKFTMFRYGIDSI